MGLFIRIYTLTIQKWNSKEKPQAASRSTWQTTFKKRKQTPNNCRKKENVSNKLNNVQKWRPQNMRIVCNADNTLKCAKQIVIKLTNVNTPHPVHSPPLASAVRGSVPQNDFRVNYGKWPKQAPLSVGHWPLAINHFPANVAQWQNSNGRNQWQRPANCGHLAIRAMAFPAAAI